MYDLKLFGFKFLYLFYCFIIYAFTGWVMESIYATSIKGRFVNRGFLNGPFCPIYGFGVLTLIVFLTPVVDNLFLLFLGGMFLTSALEYLTGFILEKAFHSTWWDYRGRFLNIKGRICLKFSIIWGILSVVVMKVLKPLGDRLIGMVPQSYKEVLFYGFMAYFIGDMIITIRSIVQLNQFLHQLRKVSVEIKSRLDMIKDTAAERMGDAEERVQSLKDRYEVLLEKRAFLFRRLIDAFPNLKYREFEIVLSDIRERISTIRTLRISMRNRLRKKRKGTGQAH